MRSIGRGVCSARRSRCSGRPSVGCSCSRSSSRSPLRSSRKLVTPVAVLETDHAAGAVERNLELLRRDWKLAAWTVGPFEAVAFSATTASAFLPAASDGINLLISTVTTPLQAAIAVVLLRALLAKVPASAPATEPVAAS